MEQFKRTEMLLGAENIEKLRNSKVVVMGLGGVGSYAAEALCRSGIGNFVLVDFDVISESNINRQLIALHSTIGEKKTEVMKARMLDINPNANIEIISEFCSPDKVDSLIQDQDFIIDAIDSLNPKVTLLEKAVKSNKRIVSCLGAGGRMDPSKIAFSDISKSWGCPLAARVRKYLRKRGIKKGIPSVYSSEKPVKGIEENCDWDESKGRKRVTVSSSVFIPGIMGLWTASYVVRELVSQE
jgi:tRNA A37 threonylcarbamoyladenosine dehydratase